MIEMTLTRISTSDEGTFGLLESEALRMHTGELPWRGNQVMVSCIPEGRYLCLPHRTTHFGRCYWVRDVPGRSEILIHPANYMGDPAKGYVSQLAGCIALGMDFGADVGPNKQDAVLKSRLALRRLIEYTAFDEFWLTIVSATQTRMIIPSGGDAL